MQARKLVSIEDLFETQRRELFGRLTELDKNMTSKYSVVERAVLEIASKTAEIDPSQLLIQV